MHITDSLYVRLKKSQNYNPMLCFHSYSDINLKLAANELNLTPKAMFNYISGYRIPPESIRIEIERLASVLDYERQLFLTEIQNNDTNLRNGSHR